MDDYVAIKSREPLEELYLFIKHHFYRRYKADKSVSYDVNDGFKIYIEKNCFSQASEAFAEFLIRKYVFFFVQELAEEYEFDMSFRERAELFTSLSLTVLNHRERNLVSMIRKDMETFSKLYSEINMDGFVVFSFRKYEEIIIEILSDALIEIKTEEEYENMLFAVSDYIAKSVPRLRTINVIRQDDKSFRYFDAEHNDITDSCRGNVLEEFGRGDYNFEDELLGVLICKKPESIVLHLRGGGDNSNFIYSLEAIFGERLKICTTECDFCKS